MDVRPPELPSEHFLRRNVRPAGRPTGRRGPVSLWRSAAVVAAFSSLVALGFWTAAVARRARGLSVSRIVVEGNRRVADGEILETLGLHPGANILALNLPALKQQILRSPWVEDVELRRVLPATLTLHVNERVPVGIAVLDRLYLIDGAGIVLDEMGPRYRDLTLPLVAGLAEEGRVVPDRARIAGRVLESLETDPRLYSAVSELDVTDGASSIRIVLRNPPMTLLASEDTLVARLSELLPIAADLTLRFPGIERVDLRFRERIYLRLRASPVSSIPPVSSVPIAEGGDHSE